MSKVVSKADLARVIGSRDQLVQRQWLEARAVRYLINLRGELVVFWVNLEAASEPHGRRREGPTDAPNLSAFA